jgi:carboxyl-terminal processing protease
MIVSRYNRAGKSSFWRHAARNKLTAGGILFSAVTGCAHSRSAAVIAEPVAPSVAVATFDSLYSKVANTYVDTAFTEHRWKAMRDSLRPRALAASTRTELDRVLLDALHYIPDSHFYIIPERVAPEESGTSSDARGTSGISARLADGKVVAWRVEPGSAAFDAGLKPGDILLRINGRDADSSVKRVEGLPEPARPRALAEALHGLNGLLVASVGDTVKIATPQKSYDLVARPAKGNVSQFGNLPPLAALVRTQRVKSSSPHGCVGVIAFNIWLPEMGNDLASAVDSARSCDGIVIDLRGNPGGVGAMVMGFAGYFVDSTRSLGTMKTRQVSLNFVINPRVNPFNGKVAILVDAMSASTSEIFATGMQRIGRARVFGERSAAAALPALMERLPSGDVFVHAVADFTDPWGKRVEGAGVIPDEVVPLRIADLAQGRDAALDAAVRWIEQSAEK